MGKWDSAMFRSIAIVGALAFLCITLLAVIDGYQRHEFMMLITLYGGSYLVISLIGWFLLGLPIHYLLSRYSERSYMRYFLSGFLISVLLGLALNLRIGLFFGTFILAQDLLFRHFVYKK
ncbi:hypothetical protein [Photobacterium sp. R1]